MIKYKIPGFLCIHLRNILFFARTVALMYVDFDSVLIAVMRAHASTRADLNKGKVYVAYLVHERVSQKMSESM